MIPKLSLLILLALFFINSTYSQDAKADKILMTNVEIKEGHVTAIDDETVQFSL